MSIFWFPEPVTAEKILVKMGYLIRQGVMNVTGGREIIEVPVHRRKIEIEATLILNDKYIKKPISVNAYSYDTKRET